MADRYLRGTGARNWNDTANWSTTSGGAGGASVPTATDNVIFDSNSGTGTLTVNATANMLDFTCTNIGAITLANAAYAFNIYGSMSLHTNLTVSFTGTGYLYFKGTGANTITTNGKVANWNRMYFDGVGGTWTNQDDMNVGGANIYLTNGTWNTNDKTITLGIFSTVAGTKTLTLGSSNFNVFNFTNSVTAGFTLNSGTSTITSIGDAFQGGDGFVFFNLIRQSYSLYYFYTSSIFKNVTIIGGTYINSTLRIFAGITINGALTLTGNNSSNYRLLVDSTTIGTPRTITCNGTVTASNVDFRDITLAGTCNKDLSAITGGSGDCGGNSGITFTSAQPQYFKKYASTGNYGDAANWFTDLALTVAGRVPLPQDLGSKFLAGSFDRACTVSCNVPRIPCLDMSEVVNTVTWSLANAISVYGGFRYNSTYVTVSGNYLITCDLHGKTISTPLYLGVLTAFANNFDVLLSNTISELIIDSGRKVRFTAGTTQTIAKATIGANVTLDCMTASTYTLALADITTAENANIKGCIAPVSKFFAEANSVDSGSNTNVVFGDYFTPQEILIENRIN